MFVLRVCACAALSFVMRVAGNDLGPEGGQYVAASLSVLTGLQTLDLGGTGSCLLLLWGSFGIVRGREFWDVCFEGVCVGCFFVCDACCRQQVGT